MSFANNTPPANNSQRPTPIDRRFDNPEAMIEAALRRVVGNSAPAASSDPIRGMVMNALEVAGVSAAGKTDSQILADYTELVRKGAQAANATAANSQATEEFAGYDINKP